MIRKSMTTKRNLTLTCLLALTVALTGCGSNAQVAETPAAQESEAQPETQQETVSAAVETVAETETEQETEAPAEWRETTEEEAKGLIPNLFMVPAGAELQCWKVLDNGTQVDGVKEPIVKMEFMEAPLYFIATAQVTGDEALNTSSVELDWIAEEDATLSSWGDGNVPGKIYRGEVEGSPLDLITWHDPKVGVSYAVQTVLMDADGFDIQAIAEQMSDPANKLGTASAEGDTKTDTTGTTTASDQDTASGEDKKPAATDTASRMFNEGDAKTLISELVGEMGLTKVDADDAEKGMFIGGDFIAKYGYKSDGNGSYQNYYTFYDLGDAMGATVTIMGWTTTAYYDYGVYTFDEVKTDLKSQAQ